MSSSARGDWVAVMIRRDLIERIYDELPDTRIAPLSRVIMALVNEALSMRRMLNTIVNQSKDKEDTNDE